MVSYDKKHEVYYFNYNKKVNGRLIETIFYGGSDYKECEKILKNKLENNPQEGMYAIRSYSSTTSHPTPFIVYEVKNGIITDRGINSASDCQRY